jgi:hypothetical protein
MPLNSGYSFSEFAPGLFGFGSDGAGELYVFDMRGGAEPTVCSVPSIPLDLEGVRVWAPSFEAFVRETLQHDRSSAPA